VSIAASIGLAKDSIGKLQGMTLPINLPVYLSGLQPHASLEQHFFSKSCSTHALAFDLMFSLTSYYDVNDGSLPAVGSHDTINQTTHYYY
jgi:hypothetical protein